MLPEYDVELLETHLLEIRLQARADAEAAALGASAPDRRGLIERLLSTFRLDPAQVPAGYQSALRAQGHLSR